MKPYKELKTPDRKSAFLMIDSMAKDGVPERGSFTIVGDLFQTDRRTMARLWQTVNSKRLQLLNNLDNDEELPPIAQLEIYSRDVKKRRGGKFKHCREEIRAKMKEIPLKKRRNLRQTSAQLGIGLATVHRLTKDKQASGKSLFR
jgi:hypothetical protein